MFDQSTVCCGLCSKSIRKNIKCELCAKYFHVKCAKISTKDYLALTASLTNWSCLDCRKVMFPLIDVTNEEFESAFAESCPTRMLP